MSTPEWLSAFFAWFAPWRASGEQIGTVSSMVTAVSLLWQPIKIYRTRSTRDIAVLFLITFGIGAMGWLWYGLTNALLPVVITNVIGLLSMIYSLTMVIKEHRSRGLTLGRAEPLAHRRQ